MRFLDRLGCHPDVFEVEEFALESNVLSGEKAADEFKRLVGSRSALLEGHAEAIELFMFEADADT